MSHRGELTERMLHLPLLLAERRHSQQELAQLFKVKARTIRRDIDALSRYYPIVDERDGRTVVYRFSDDYRYHPPPFTPIELATLLLAQESIAATGLTALGSPFARYGRSLLAKVRSSLHPLVRDKLDALAAVFGSASVAAKDFAPHAVLIDRLTQAAVERRRVRLRYYTLATDSVTERTVEPYAVYFDPDGATLKLIGYDHHRKKVIPFAIDHIRALRETEETFERPAGFDLQSYLSANCFNGIHGDPITVRLRASGVTARVFAERLFHELARPSGRTSGCGTACGRGVNVWCYLKVKKEASSLGVRKPPGFFWRVNPAPSRLRPHLDSVPVFPRSLLIESQPFGGIARTEKAMLGLRECRTLRVQTKVWST